MRATLCLRRMRRILPCLAPTIGAAFWCGASVAGELPQDFVYLRDVDASIVQDMRYAGPLNFTGAPVDGYDAPECVLVRQAAEALKAVQAELRERGLGLKVYDCYRPARAVAAFVAWAKLPDDPKVKAFYYPKLQKSALFRLGYIATRSGHSRGATVDLTLVPLTDSATPDFQSIESKDPCTAERSGDGSLDMGTSFDCFDVKAHTITPGLTEEQRRNRALLVEAMRRQGFQNYEREWWHYTLKPEPYPHTYFDFPILPQQSTD